MQGGVRINSNMRCIEIESISECSPKDKDKQ